MYDTLPAGNPEVTAEKNESSFTIDSDTAGWLKALKDKCERINSSEWLNVKRQQIRARNYFDGRQYGEVTPQLNWIDYPKQIGDISYTAPTYQAHIQTALMEMSKGRTELSFSHVSGDSRRGDLIAKIAETRFKAHKRKLFDTVKEQQENIHLLLSGIGIRYTYLSDCNYTQKVPSVAESGMEAEPDADDAGVMVCAECYAPMKEPGEECENCGNDVAVSLTSSKPSVSASMSYDDVAQKESNWCSVDPLGCVWYFHATTVEESPYFIWKQALLVDIVKSKYPDVQIKQGVMSPELNYKAFGETATPGSQLSGSDDAQDKCEIILAWFDPPLYANYIPKHDLKLRDGIVAPQNVPLGKTFPNGMLVAFNDNSILDVRGEDKNKKWTVAPYVTRPGTMIGAGTTAALDDQDTKNDLRNLHMQSIYNDAFRKEFIDPQFIDPDQIPSDPTERAVLRNSPTNGRIVGSAIDVLPPSPLSPDAYAMEERLDGEMQMLLGTFSGNQSGMPDLKAVQDTAAGMQMWREMTIGRYYPMLAIRADRLDREQAYQLLENDQKYLSPEQWDKIKGDYSEEAIEAFLKCDLREELLIEVVPESFMPVSRSQTQSGLMGWSQFLQNTQAPPDSEISGYAADLFNIPKKLVSNDAFESMAYADIDAFREQSEAIVADKSLGDLDNFDLQDPYTQMMAQLILGQADRPISYKMDNLSIYADALRDWWATDEGRYSSNLLKAAVLLRMEEIDGAAITKQQDDYQKAAAAQAPAMQAQQQQAQAQAKQQQAAAQQQQDADDQRREEDIQVKAAEKAVDIEQSDAQRAFDANEAEKQRQHDLEMARMTNQQAPNAGR